MSMKNANVFLAFKSKMAKLTDTEKFWLMNRMAFEANYEISQTTPNVLNSKLEGLLRLPVSTQNTVEWWWALRELSCAPLFYKILRI
jgi:hypothetical protein